MNIRSVGDVAVLCEVEDLTSAHRLRAAIVEAHYDGVLDVVPAWRTVLVTTETPECARRLVVEVPGLVLPATEELGTRAHVIGVSYDGPDLGYVAEHAGLSLDDVVRRHLAPTYVVAFLGFQPGFPYLAGLDPVLRTPRRSTPRVRTPAGAVAIADAVTGIYPAASPGGWQLIGRTDVSMFDPAGEPPALLAPGDTVRFTT